LTVGRNWSEPWYAVYGLLAIAAVGITPLLLPQYVNRGGHAAAVGLVMAAFNLGGLSAPIWGRMAERRLHKPLLLFGLAAVTIGLALLPASSGAAAWSTFALLQGAGIAAVSTVAGLLIVERHPREEWDQRMGWLLTFFGGGQVVGLLVASLFSGVRSGVGLLVAAGLVAAAIPLAAIFVRTPPPPASPVRAGPQPTRIPHVPATPASVHHHFGQVSWGEFISAIRSPFGLFIASNTITIMGAALIFTAYPLLFAGTYGVTPARSSLAFGISAVLAIFWYPMAGAVSQRRSPIAVQVFWLLARCAGLGILLAMTLVSVPFAGWWAESGFLVVVNSWPFISVSGTVLAASLAPADEGTAMGIYNGSTAIANTVGAFLTGAIAQAFGYRVLPLFALGTVLPGILLLLPLCRRTAKARHNSIGASYG